MKPIDLIKCCLNPKVIVAVLVIFGLSYIVLPKSITASVAPILLLLICPLSMGLMMLAMRHTEPSNKQNGKEKQV